jgi:hypothetical protein
VAEQEALLKDESDVAAEVVEVEIPNVMAPVSPVMPIRSPGAAVNETSVSTGWSAW